MICIAHQGVLAALQGSSSSAFFRGVPVLPFTFLNPCNSTPEVPGQALIFCDTGLCTKRDTVLLQRLSTVAVWTGVETGGCGIWKRWCHRSSRFVQQIIASCVIKMGSLCLAPVGSSYTIFSRPQLGSVGYLSQDVENWA